MWSDKETTEDLLGYTVHASLLKSVVTMIRTFQSLLDYTVIGVLEKQVSSKFLKKNSKMIMIPSWFILTVGRLRVSTMPRWH